MAAVDLPYCDISIQESWSKLNRRLMSSGFFHHPHHIQLHLKVIDSLFTEHFYHHVLKSQESHPLQSVYCRSLFRRWPSVAPWQTGESPLPQRIVYDCFNVVSLVFHVPAKSQPHINWLPCADLKITSAHIAKAERNLNCTQSYYLYPDRDDDIHCPWCTCPSVMMLGSLTTSVSFRKKSSCCPLQKNIDKVCITVGYIQCAALAMTSHLKNVSVSEFVLSPHQQVCNVVREKCVSKHIQGGDEIHRGSWGKSG